MEKQTISIIVPIYNMGEKLPLLINSLLQQSFTDFEVILVNDGSKDNTESVCENIASKDSRFRILQQENQGVASARNNGVIKSTGQYIVFLDADDEVPSNYLQELAELVILSNADIGICDVVVQDFARCEIGRFSCGNRLMSAKKAIGKILSRKDINSGPYGKIFSRSIVVDNSFPTLKVYEDFVYVIDCMISASVVASTNRTEYYYIQNADGAMSNNSKKPSTDIINATSMVLEHVSRQYEIDDYSFYTAMSHVFQYCKSVYKSGLDYDGKMFLGASRHLYRNYWKHFLRCKCFKKKELVVYILFSIGFDVFSIILKEP